MPEKASIEQVTVIVPENPFVRPTLKDVKHCLAALDVQKLMVWWPGRPHEPHRDPKKVRSIQRSLDWKRVAQIAAYLLQEEVDNVPQLIDQYFAPIYEPLSLEPGRQWPPKVPKVADFQRSEFPTFANVLLHVNGATMTPVPNSKGIAELSFEEENLSLTVIDGQHRINGAYLAVSIKQSREPGARWEIPAEVFLDLDARGALPRNQAQIFIDVNFYQKKVDRSLVADLFPTTRAGRRPIDDKERAQDLGRNLMLEQGPLRGMIQIPGIKYGVPDVVTLATLNAAIEDVIPAMDAAGIGTLNDQAAFLAQCLDAWLSATGRKESIVGEKIDPENVVYQGRVIVSFLALLPACILHLKEQGLQLISDASRDELEKWLHQVLRRAGFLEKDRFMSRSNYKKRGFLGSGGIARFRDTLWAAVLSKGHLRVRRDRVADLARANRVLVSAKLAIDESD